MLLPKKAAVISYQVLNVTIPFIPLDTVWKYFWSERSGRFFEPGDPNTRLRVQLNSHNYSLYKWSSFTYKAWPKDSSILREQLKSNNFCFVFNTKYTAIALQKK